MHKPALIALLIALAAATTARAGDTPDCPTPTGGGNDPGYYPPDVYRRHVLGESGLADRDSGPTTPPPLKRPPGFYSPEEYRRHVLGDTGLPPTGYRSKTACPSAP